MSRIHARLSRLGNWGTNVENSWANLPITFAEATALVEPPWNLGGTLVKLGKTWVEPWWDLPENLLAAQDRSAPENHRESESNSAPKPLITMPPEDTKAIAVGEKVSSGEYQTALGGTGLEAGFRVTSRTAWKVAGRWFRRTACSPLKKENWGGKTGGMKNHEDQEDLESNNSIYNVLLAYY